MNGVDQDGGKPAGSRAEGGRKHDVNTSTTEALELAFGRTSCGPRSCVRFRPIARLRWNGIRGGGEKESWIGAYASRLREGRRNPALFDGTAHDHTDRRAASRPGGFGA